MTFSQTLNARQRPETLQLKNGAGTTLQSLTYGYSAAGDVTWILDGVDGADTVNNLTYDGLHRLKTANGIWGSYSYTYDGLNNLISRTGTNPLSYGYDPATNRLSNVSGAVSRNYGYNPRGGMIGDGTKSFTLNSNDQITNITGIATYGYDGNGKRVKTTKADGSIEYAIYDQSGTLVSHALVTAGQNNNDVQLDGRTIAEVLNGVPTWLHSDLLGSPRLATTGSGSIAWREHYGPYGEKLNGVNDKIGYTGHAYDAESQLTYAQARFYDPAVGRFMSMDPIGFTGNPASFTRYAYANNNPFAYTDPTGMCAVSLSGCDGSSNDLGGIEGTQASGSRIPSASTAMMAMMMGGVAGGNAGVQGNAIAANSSNSSSSCSSGGTNLDIEGVQVASSGAPPPPEAPQPSTTAVIDSAIKRGDVKQLETLRDIASPQESAAITRALTPARNLIQGRLKRSPSYRSELEEKTYTEIVKLSRAKGEEANAAKQMKKLIEQGSRLDEKVR